MKKALKQLKAIKSLGGSMRLAAESWPSKFQTLISTILSARSLDETTIRICKELFKKYPNAKKLANANIKDIQKIIRSINFYRNKSKNIINCAKVLDEKYHGQVPEDFDKLIELSGVGRKTANVFLSEQGHPTMGIDTHITYISNYLGWTKSHKQEKIEEDLKKLFPVEYRQSLNPILVKFGKHYTSKKEKNKVLDEIKKIK